MRERVTILSSILVILVLIVTACAGQAPAASSAADEVASESAADTGETAAEETTSDETMAEDTVEESVADDEEMASEGYVLAFMPKFVGHPVFAAANEGAQAAGEELGITVNYVGPTDIDVAQQVEWVENLTAQQVDGIMVGALDPNALVPALKTANEAGIVTVSWDADVAEDGRTVYVSPPADEDLGKAMAEMLGKAMDYEGQWAWLSSGPEVANQVAWIDATMAYMEANPDKFGNMEMVRIAYGESDDTLSYTETEGLLAAFPDLKGIIAPDAAGFPAAARAVQDAGRCGEIELTGLALPSAMRSFVEDGCVDEFALWDFFDLGYLTVYTTHKIVAGEIEGKPGETFEAGELGERTIREGGIVVLGEPLIFDANNIDDFDF